MCKAHHISRLAFLKIIQCCVIVFVIAPAYAEILGYVNHDDNTNRNTILFRRAYVETTGKHPYLTNLISSLNNYQDTEKGCKEVMSALHAVGCEQKNIMLLRNAVSNLFSVHNNDSIKAFCVKTMMQLNYQQGADMAKIYFNRSDASMLNKLLVINSLIENTNFYGWETLVKASKSQWRSERMMVSNVVDTLLSFDKQNLLDETKRNDMLKMIDNMRGK